MYSEPPFDVSLFVILAQNYFSVNTKIGDVQSHSVFGFLSALSGIGTRGNHPQESGLQTPPTRVILTIEWLCGDVYIFDGCNKSKLIKAICVFKVNCVIILMTNKHIRLKLNFD